MTLPVLATKIVTAVNLLILGLTLLLKCSDKHWTLSLIEVTLRG